MKNLIALCLAVTISACCTGKDPKDYLLDEDGNPRKLKYVTYKTINSFRHGGLREDNTVIWLPDNTPEELELLSEITRQAIAAWNKRLGMNLLTYKESEGYQKVDVTVKFKRTDKKKLYGTAVSRTPRGTGSINVLYNIYLYRENLPELDEDPDFWIGIMKHEIGHSLGLGHNTNMNSLMYCRYNGDKKISNRSVRLLGELYPELEVMDNLEDPWEATPHIHKLGGYQLQSSIK